MNIPNETERGEYHGNKKLSETPRPKEKPDVDISACIPKNVGPKKSTTIVKYYDGPRTRLSEHIDHDVEVVGHKGDTSEETLIVRINHDTDTGSHSLLRDTYELLHGHHDKNGKLIIKENDHPDHNEHHNN